MIFIYSIILIFIIAGIIAMRGYRHEYKEAIVKKLHPLSFSYGLCFFLIDLYVRTLRKLHLSQNREPFSNLRKKLLKLNPGSDITIPLYLALAKPTALCLLITVCCLGTGIVFSGAAMSDSDTPVTSLKRPTDGSSYSLRVDSEDETAYVELKVPEKVYEHDEVIKIFDSYKQDIITAVLNENQSPDHVTMPLSFPSHIGSEGIALSFEPEDPSLIDYDGGLIYENISFEGVHTSIYISMKLHNTEAILVMGVTLFPNEVQEGLMLQAKLNNYISQNSDPHSDSISLPAVLDGKKLRYSINKNNEKIYFMLLSSIACIILFFAFKKDIDAKINNRNRQLMQDYPELVSKLLLLCSAGLSIKNALIKIADDYKSSRRNKRRFAYEELSITLNSLESGKAEIGAYSEFGRHCGLMPYIRFGALLEQNLNKGISELRFLLSNEVQDAFENYKSDIISRSKYAETKLLFPMILILIIVMVMIMVPSFMSI